MTPLAVPPPTTTADRGRLLSDFLVFAREHAASRDIDPVYPVLRAFYDRQGFDRERQLWFTALYLAFYHLGSAAVAFETFPTPQAVSRAFCGPLPCAVERRGLRGGRAADFLASYRAAADAAGSQDAFLRGAIDPDTLPWEAYEAVWETVQTVWSIGRWAAFKWCELLKSVHDLPIEAPDMRLQFCTGPLAGLCRLTGVPIAAPLRDLNAAAAWLADWLALDPGGIALSWEELETALCDFNSLCDGHYYLGHDIDQMQAQLSIAPPALRDALFRARWDALPHAYLGERHGWLGTDPDRRRRYRDTGVIVPGSAAYRGRALPRRLPL